MGVALVNWTLLLIVTDADQLIAFVVTAHWYFNASWFSATASIFSESHDLT